jgi:hypothetical protein
MLARQTRAASGPSLKASQDSIHPVGFSPVHFRILEPRGDLPIALLGTPDRTSSVAYPYSYRLHCAAPHFPLPLLDASRLRSALRKVAWTQSEYPSHRLSLCPSLGLTLRSLPVFILAATQPPVRVV